MIPVTKPYLPNIKEYKNYIDSIWKRTWLTNNGPLVQNFESALRRYLNIENLLFVANGTIALQMAIRALKLKGEIITTPFSYIATTSSIGWESCEPVFVDISEQTLNINPNLIEKSITPKTSAILATHCFGNACDIESIEKIAKDNGLKVIYDAAHCFGSTYKSQSIFSFGDISTTSFHATKIMHTVEGGAVFTKTPTLIEKIQFLRNFGHNGPGKFEGLGINGKNSEFHAAMGLCVLKSIDDILSKRKRQSKYYDKILDQLKYRKPETQEYCIHNYSYYPVILPSKKALINSLEALEDVSIYPRRYFYPSLSSLDYVRNDRTPVSDSISECIMCLPLFHDLQVEDQERIADVLLRNQGK